MRMYSINDESYVDGPGRRTVLFLQGCAVGCRGCQSMHLWKAEGPHTDVAVIAKQLLATGLNITISGGEPFDQVDELAQLLQLLRDARPDIHIIIYSGYVYERLLTRPDADVVETALGLADVLVDGPYIEAHDHPGMQYRGSPNQRPIDLRATEAGAVVVLDWDKPVIIITDKGDLIATAPVLELLELSGPLGIAASARRCGQSINC